MSKKSLVIYFSESSNTRSIARIIQSKTNSDIQEILTEIPYVKSYNALVNQAKQEIDECYCPSIKKMDCNLDDYDMIFLGTPNWWSTIAPPITTFISENNLAGKVIVPFITHGGGGRGHADKDIKKLCPDAKILDALDIYENGGLGAEKKVDLWLKKVGLS